MADPIRVVVIPYEHVSRPKRLAVGDVVRCSTFTPGFQFSDSPRVTVGWRRLGDPDYFYKNGKGVLRHDPSRAVATFLITQIVLETHHGPDDVFPDDEWRMSRLVHAVRLTSDFVFTEQSEEILFSLNEPMSLADPDEDSIEILGCAELPIVWTKLLK